MTGPRDRAVTRLTQRLRQRIDSMSGEVPTTIVLSREETAVAVEAATGIGLTVRQQTRGYMTVDSPRVSVGLRAWTPARDTVAAFAQAALDADEQLRAGHPLTRADGTAVSRTSPTVTAACLEEALTGEFSQEVQSTLRTNGVTLFARGEFGSPFPASRTAETLAVLLAGNAGVDLDVEPEGGTVVVSGRLAVILRVTPDLADVARALVAAEAREQAALRVPRAAAGTGRVRA